MRDLADAGVGVLMISSDMEEIVGVSDRVAVMHEGAIAGFLDRDGLSEHAVLSLAVGHSTLIHRGSMPAMFNRNDLSLLVLILVVGTAVALINPRFLSPINLSNTANLIGLFGIFSVAQAFVIISAGSSSRPARPSRCSAWCSSTWSPRAPCPRAWPSRWSWRSGQRSASSTER